MDIVAHRRPFVVVLVITAIVSLAVFRLPGTFLSQIGNHRPLDDVQADWAFRLLVVVTIAQALYAGFWVLQPERVRKARERDEKVRAMSREEIVASVARNAAGISALTLVYGLAALGVTGHRGGFWLWPGIAVVQAAWYYRQVGEIARWIALQPAFVAPDPPRSSWQPTAPDYTPPLARGLSPAPPAEGSLDEG